MSRGSGEWLYSDPIERQPLMSRRRGGIGAPILLVVLGLLVVSIFVFLVPALLGGGTAPAAVASPTPGASRRPAASHAPSRTFEPSPSPSLPAEPDSRVYTVKPGNTLSFIADRFDVSQRSQCHNVITQPEPHPARSEAAHPARGLQLSGRMAQHDPATASPRADPHRSRPGSRVDGRAGALARREVDARDLARLDPEDRVDVLRRCAGSEDQEVRLVGVAHLAHVRRAPSAGPRRHAGTSRRPGRRRATCVSCRGRGRASPRARP